MADRLPFMDELPLAIDANPRAPQTLDELGVGLHSPDFRNQAAGSRVARPGGASGAGGSEEAREEAVDMSAESSAMRSVFIGTATVPRSAVVSAVNRSVTR